MPILNYDSNGDGNADINIDFDGDGIPDINIDSNYDGIPDLNIDGDGDGIPDYNLDEEGSGIPTKNLITIKEWKPEINGDKDGIKFSTMSFNEESNNPSDPTEDDTHKEKPTTSVKGQYNPATSIGGANTGDSSDLILYVGICCITIGVIFYMVYKKEMNI